MENSPAGEQWQNWAKFALVSLIYFQITASTFTSLGVALPFMVEDLEWSWSNAGLGFSVLAFMVGIAGRLPSWTLRRFGVRATFASGGALMTSGFVLLASTTDLKQYFIGAGLAGLGFTLSAIVPGVAVINHLLPHRRSLAIGMYMMIGGLGGVAGPLMVTSVVAVSGSWRMHWWIMAALIAGLALMAIVFLRIHKENEVDHSEADLGAEKHSDRVYMTKVEWPFSHVLRTPQFYIIAAAMTMTLFGGVTTNSWAVTHMGNMGVAVGIAAGALSVQALVNSMSRAVGGVLATRLDPKWLLAAGLIGEITGMIALSIADSPVTIAIFAIGEGFGFGMCLFAATILLVNYYGPKESPKTMGTMHLITTLAMLGPFLGGYIADQSGGFADVFIAYAIAMTICLIAVILMRPPKPLTA
jgi:MFS family permease